MTAINRPAGQVSVIHEQTSAGMAPHVVATDGALTPLGYQQINDLSAAASLTVPAGARVALIVAKDQAVRWRDDGTAPTATVGMPLAVDTPLTYNGDLSAIEFIEVTAGAELNVSYYA